MSRSRYRPKWVQVASKVRWRARKHERSERQAARREMRSLKQPSPVRHRNGARWDVW